MKTTAHSDRDFDIAPFALPRTPVNEVRFETGRDIRTVVVTFKTAAPQRIGLSYLHKVWPGQRHEQRRDMDNPCSFGWVQMDDWFNSQWRQATLTVRHPDTRTAVLTFKGLTSEFPDTTGYDVRFRRTLGVRIDVREAESIARIAVYTVSPPAQSTLMVELDAGKRTPGKMLRFEGHNVEVSGITLQAGVTLKDNGLKLGAGRRAFAIALRHIEPAHRYSGDDGRLTFVLDREAFTISLSALQSEGPVFFAEQGVFIHAQHDPCDFAAYQQQTAGAETLAERVRKLPEQSFHGAYHGQPRPHAVHYNVGVKHNRQRFMIEANGDVVLTRKNMKSIQGKDTARFKNKGDARFMFGLETWYAISRQPDPAPVLACTLGVRSGALTMEQRSLAVPLLRSILEDASGGDATIIALLRFRFRNTGTTPVTATLPINYSQASARSQNPYHGARQNEALVPHCEHDELVLARGRLCSRLADGEVLRAVVDTKMTARRCGQGITLARRLNPGETVDLVIKIPFIALDAQAELAALKALDFDACDAEVSEFWRREAARGAKLHVPEPHLSELHAAHVAHVQVTDVEMPDSSGLINTSVGTSTYGNFSNESCMIVQELDQRGLHEDARRRLDLWVKYQGTAPQPGNFTDYDGMYFGAGGFESGHYNQHHGWVLWCLCEHYLLARDTVWFKSVADSVIAGADWVFRQRRNTMGDLPHSRGWERGFLPAGSLEDVTDFYYWLSTNALTWRGTDHAARALAAIGHPEAARVRREADRHRRDLVRGFNTMRRYSPLVRLRDGRWVPHFPSRLYCRGRDVGWIRETLEGAVYLLTSGLYKSTGKEAPWILDDYQDNRYTKPPYGYAIPDFEANWFDRAGFSIQPNLLAGLMPHMERDEPELYIWMFFNAWCACYREEIGAMVEHPMPVLGYSNAAEFKTSDQANAVMWLRYMLAWWNHEMLHFGRAMPREWLADGNGAQLDGLATYFGRVSVQYIPDPTKDQIVMKARVAHPQEASQILARFRHPEKKPIRSVRVNGKPWKRFDPKKEDVDITGMGKSIVVEVMY